MDRREQQASRKKRRRMEGLGGCVPVGLGGCMYMKRMNKVAERLKIKYVNISLGCE